ncbi:hypothetical protein CEXT_773271 [Caerostris extrusa]|uniref:Uncharacterized protein n=1 Tax=Caerostris extrusa TaxID=172846 RepID=A0AAV4X167_CAEEX|nr:hypothetical protein CEXT_773271 [Caerostris extrusa]
MAAPPSEMGRFLSERGGCAPKCLPIFSRLLLGGLRVESSGVGRSRHNYLWEQRGGWLYPLACSLRYWGYPKLINKF